MAIALAVASGLIAGVVLVAFGASVYLPAIGLLIVAALRGLRVVSAAVAVAGATSFVILASAVMTCEPSPARQCGMDRGLTALLITSAALAIIGSIAAAVRRSPLGVRRATRTP